MLFSRTVLLSLCSWTALNAATLTLGEAVSQFLEHNSDLHIARYEADKSKADLITAKEHPNPILMTGYEFIDVGHRFSDKARGSNAQLTVNLSKAFETAGKRSKRIKLADDAIVYNDFLYSNAVRNGLSTLISTYYALIADQADLTNAQENAKSYDVIIAVAKAKMESGFLSSIDYQKILIQKIDYLKEVETYSLTLDQDRQSLLMQLSLDPSEKPDLDNPQSLPLELPKLDALLSKADARPDCRAAKQAMSVARSSLSLEKANAVPNLTVGAEYASFGPTYEPLGGVILSMPLPVFDKNEGDIEKSRIGTLEASTAYDKTLREARGEITVDYNALRSRQSLYKMMQENFEHLQELKMKQEKVFSLKGMSVLELLDTQKNYREFQKNLNHARSDLYAADAVLKLNTGEFPYESKGN